jgi:hypothetical protein
MKLAMFLTERDRFIPLERRHCQQIEHALPASMCFGVVLPPQ